MDSSLRWNDKWNSMIDRDSLYRSEAAASPDDGSGSGVYDEPGYTPDDNSPSLREQERKAADSGAWKTNVRGEKSPSRLSGLLAGGKKKGIIAGALGAVIIGFIGLMIHLISSSLLLPHVKAVISERRLASSARHLTSRTSAITTDELFLSQASSEEKDLLSKNALAKLMYKINPQSAVKEMQSSGALSFVKDAKTGRITQVLVDGEAVDVPRSDFFNFVKNRSQAKQFYKDLYQKVDQALLRDGQSELVRSRVGKAVLSQFGGQLFFWTRPQIQKGNNNAASAATSEERSVQTELFDRTVYDNPDASATTAHTDGADKAASKALTDEKMAISNPKVNVNPDQLSLLEDSGAAKAVSSYSNGIVSFLKSPEVAAVKYLGFPVYQLMVPACMVYDTSIKTASAIMKAAESGALQAWFSLSAAADQQKAGVVTATAVGGFNKFLKWFSNSIPDKYSNGQSFDTLASPIAQASKAQSFNLFGDNGTIEGFMNTLCPHILSTTWATAIAVLLGLQFLSNFIAPEGFFTDGAAFKATLGSISEKFGSVDGIKALMSKSVNTFVTKLTAKGVEKNLLSSNALKFVGKNVAGAGANAGIVYLAQMLVLSEMKAFTNGADPHEFVNEADMGATLNNAELERQGDYGRPMTASETAQSDQANLAYTQQVNNSQSVYQRYFALSNPTSSLSNGIIAANNYVEHPKQLAVAVLKAPFALMSSVKNFFGNMFNHKALAASNTKTDNQDYNTVQWGWTPAEDAILQNDPTYDPLVNATILQSSGQIDQLNKTYGNCYTSPMSDLLTGNGTEKNRLIPLDQNGVLVDKSGTNSSNKLGFCTPSNLGYSNTSQDGTCTGTAIEKLVEAGVLKSVKSACTNMVFRWRVYNSYLNAAQNMSDIQNAGSTSGS